MMWSFNVKASKYLFDTNILSEIIKQPSGQLAQKIIQLDNDSYCTSIIVACELRYGIFKKNSTVLQEKVERLLANMIVEPLGEDVDCYYAKLRVALEKNGQLIGAHDMLIASHALALNTILITANEREFLRVPNLSVENWLKS
jgi:tRNA(fMet)-specific endonuclease VapC